MTGETMGFACAARDSGSLEIREHAVLLVSRLLLSNVTGNVSHFDIRRRHMCTLFMVC